MELNVNEKEKQFDCIQFKETLQAALWKKSKAANLEEYTAWLRKETSKIGNTRASPSDVRID